jgi:hypothetical protein
MYMFMYVFVYVSILYYVHKQTYINIHKPKKYHAYVWLIMLT